MIIRIWYETYLHGAIVDLNSIELSCGFVSTGRLAEVNSSDATALPVGSISEEDASNGSNGFREIVLEEIMVDKVSPKLRSLTRLRCNSGSRTERWERPHD